MNFDNDYYLIDRKGYAKKVEKDHIIYKDSLALLDPCDVLSRPARYCQASCKIDNTDRLVLISSWTNQEL